jgi:hypothetical protein
MELTGALSNPFARDEWLLTTIGDCSNGCSGASQLFA